jgi:hypothetical protein
MLKGLIETSTYNWMHPQTNHPYVTKQEVEGLDRDNNIQLVAPSN